MSAVFECPECGDALVPRCFYCGELTEDNAIAVETHILTCEKHPYARLREQKAQLKGDNAGLQAQVALMTEALCFMLDRVKRLAGLMENDQWAREWCDQVEQALSAAPEVAWSGLAKAWSIGKGQVRLDVLNGPDMQSSLTTGATYDVVVLRHEQAQKSEQDA